MIVELEFDVLVEARLFFSLPAALLDVLGREKQALYEATGSAHEYGSEAACEVEAAGKRFLVFVRSGGSYSGEGGEEVHVVRVLHVIENTSSRA